MIANEYLVFCSPGSRKGYRIITGFCLFFSFLCLNLLHSQNFDQYQRLKHTGNLPKDFLLSSTEKFQRKINNIQQGDGLLQKAEEAFYQENFYYINELLLSGKVLFNDPVTKYINQLADHLLKGEPELRKKIRLYAVKSPSANAFAANNGIILVNIGLISKLENEAQLAFILCHEISHFTQKHPLDIFLQSKVSEKTTAQSARNYAGEEIILNRNLYSQDKEKEADSLGLELYMASSYDLQASTTVFDILIKSKNPFANQDFDPAFFETPSLQFPDSFFTNKSLRLEQIQDGNASESSSHLTPEIRKQFVEKRVSGLFNDGRELFLLGKDQFMLIRKICRFESSYYFLVEKDYEKAIYSAWFLLKDNPESLFLQKIIAQALYGLAKHAMAGKLWDVREELSLSAEFLHLSQIIEQLEDLEMATFSLMYNWKTSKIMPEDVEIQMMVEDLMKVLSQNYVAANQSKNNSITIVDSLHNESFIYGALIVLMEEDSIFCSRLTENINHARQQMDLGIFKLHGDQSKKRQRKIAASGFNLNLKKVVFVEPSYQRIDNRLESPLQFIESEKREKEYIDMLAKHSEDLEIDYKIITTYQLQAEDIETFKDLVLLKEWINEKTTSEGLHLVSLNQAEIQQLAKKYGTSHFIWSEGLSLTRPRAGKRIAMLAGILFPPILLYSGWYVATPYHDTLIYTMVYDIERGRYLILYPKLIKMKDKFDVLNSVTYDLLLQIKSARN